MLAKIRTQRSVRFLSEMVLGLAFYTALLRRRVAASKKSEKLNDYRDNKINDSIFLAARQKKTPLYLSLSLSLNVGSRLDFTLRWKTNSARKTNGRGNVGES